MSLFSSFVRQVISFRLRGPRPRLARRARFHCPHSGDLVEADLLIGRTGQPEFVLRCAGAAECPPACDQACRILAEAVTGPAVALLVLPHGSGPPEEID